MFHFIVQKVFSFRFIHLNIDYTDILFVEFTKNMFSYAGAGKIPEAPKLPGKQGPPAQKITNFPKALISKSAGSKTQNPPQLPAMSAREELMMAIRNRGGVQGLRKV